MKKILCYGDSNTWGYRGSDGKRFERDERWPGVMSSKLGSGYEIIEEGLNGRTTVWDDPIEGHKNGETYLYPCLDTHAPIDLVIIMLGTNDTKLRFSLSAFDIAAGMEKLVKILKKSECGRGGEAPKVLVLCPAPIGKVTVWSQMFEGAKEKSEGLSELYADIAKRHGCAFFDVGSVARTTDLDGVHFDARAHKIIGNNVAKAVAEIFR